MDFQPDKVSELRQYLANEFAMDAEEINEMLDIFFESMGELVTSAESQLAASAAEQLGATGHAIKGSSANINAKGISKLGLALENGGRDNDLEKCQEAVAGLKKALSQLKSDYLNNA